MPIANTSEKFVNKTIIIRLLTLSSLNMLFTEVIPYVNKQTKISVRLQCKESLQQSPTVTVKCRTIINTLFL